MDLRTKPVTYKGKDTPKVKEMYTSAFPAKERMPFGLMLAMAKMPSTDFLSFYDKEALCGFAYLAKTKKLAFVMFLAVDPNNRSKGYGSSILDAIQARYPQQKIIVSIERCDVEAADLEQRLRRKRFYLKNGYCETGYLIELAKQKQEVLVKNGEFDSLEFRLFFLTYSNFTMLPKLLQMPSPATLPASDKGKG